MSPIDALFHNLDRWRHLPNYQLERRADVFFSLYLRGLVEEQTGCPLEEEILPELPIKRDLIWPEHRTDKSVKVDYALFARDRSKVFFVELKTDAGSRRDAQDDYLATAVRLGFTPIVEGIRSILGATSSHQKYHHLATALARLGYLELPSDLESYVYPLPRPGLSARLQEVRVIDRVSTIEVLYVQPEKTEGDRCIDFETFAAYVQRFDDPVSQRFAERLLTWREPAGSIPPP